MVWSTHRESLINVVTGNKPKMLTPVRFKTNQPHRQGLDQKVRGQVQVLLTHLTQTSRHRQRGET